jgi:Uma2 family endonuclease
MKPEDPIQAEEPVMEYSQLDLDGTYSYIDYLRWHFKERVELIRGKIMKMSPAPNVRHQSLISNMSGLFYNHFHKQSCLYFIAPFDVRLPIANLRNGKENTVVQPDLCIICDLSKLDHQGCAGAPDLVVEILSPGNSNHEMKTKFDLYQESGVKEYWIVETEKRLVFVYHLQNGKFIGLQPFTEGMEVKSQLFPDLNIPVSELFYNIL